MVTRGRNICNTLKAIRKQIADANGIDYSPEECEQDVRYLEQELRLKQIAGKVIKVAGVALGITTITTSTTSCATQRTSYNSTSSLTEEVIPISYQEYTSKDSTLLK